MRERLGRGPGSGWSVRLVVVVLAAIVGASILGAWRLSRPGPLAAPASPARPLLVTDPGLEPGGMNVGTARPDVARPAALARDGREPTPLAPSLRDPLAGFRALRGQVGVVLLADGQEQAALAPERPLAVASNFKLAVLAALADEVAAGRRSWHDVVELQPAWKSLPSGILQDWPTGAPLTLYTLATLMIARSDNTAADSLIAVLGRDTVGRLAPRNHPLLTTREWYALTLAEDPTWLARYRGGDAAERQALLADLATWPPPDRDRWQGKPVALDVEWQLTPRELCGLMARVADLPFVQIAHGMIDPAPWQRVAFKGGAEPGVLSVTAHLQRRSGPDYCLAAIWNDEQPLDEPHFARLVADLVARLP